MLISEVKAGMVLAQDIVDDRGNLLLEQGMALTDYYLKRLQQLGVNNIPVYDPYAAELKKTMLVAPETREQLNVCFRALFNKKNQEIINPGLNTVYIKQIQLAAGQMIDETEKNLAYIVNVQVRQPTADEIGHAVNVCLLAVAAGLYIKLPRPVLLDLALGALFHDLGKAVVPNINNPAFDQERLHPIYGQQLLLKNKIGSIPARIAAEHHERYDGQGYPAGLAGKEIHPLSRLVAIANYFDNAINAAGISGAPRHTITEEMLKNGNSQFDLYLLRAFFHTTPLYQVGSLVRLTTNQLAYVVKNKVRFAATPTVELAEQNVRPGILTATGKLIDLALRPNIAIAGVIAE